MRICRFVTQQLVPASPELEHTVQDGSRYICVGLDALSAADELVEGVSLDLQQVIGKMRQATHTKYVPSVDFGANKVAVLHTLVQVSPAVLVLPWAARYNTWLLIKLMPKGVAFFFFFSPRAVLVMGTCRHGPLPFVMLCVPCRPIYVIGTTCMRCFHVTSRFSVQ